MQKSHKSKIEKSFGIIEGDANSEGNIDDEEILFDKMPIKKPKTSRLQEIINIKEDSKQQTEKIEKSKINEEIAEDKIDKLFGSFDWENLSNQNPEENNEKDEKSENKSIEAKSELEQEEKPQLKRKRPKLQGNSNEIENLLDEINKEDEMIISKEDYSKDQEKGKDIKLQYNFWKNALSIRHSIQNVIENSKKLPKSNKMGLFTRNSNEIRKLIYKQNVAILKQIDFIQKIQNSIFTIFDKNNESATNPITKNNFKDKLKLCIQNTNLKSKEKLIAKFDFNTDQIQKALEKNINKKFMPWIEKIIDIWSQKTILLNSNINKYNMTQLLHTPIGQAKKAIENINKHLPNTQLKRESFRILGEPVDNLQENSDENIYDDREFFVELMKEFLSDENDLEGEGGTQQYLSHKKLKDKGKAKKNVDRKSSKNRKVKFDVYPKLVNFMAPSENNFILEGREEIIKNLCKGAN